MMMRRRGRRDREAGFTLIELMIAIALLGVGLAFITNMFLGGWRLWKRTYDELLMQRDTRDTITRITRALREGSPGSVTIDNLGGNPLFSRIAFQDGRNQLWVFTQVGPTVYYTLSPTGLTPAGKTVTQFMMSNVTSLTFTYPSFQDPALIDVSVTAQKTPYAGAMKPITIQIVERVALRNP